MIGTVLEKIVARTKRDLIERQGARPLRTFESELSVSRLNFAGALQTTSSEGWPALIAEFKPKSPSRGAIREGARPADIVPIYDRYASGVSVLCDQPFFGGSYATLRAARAVSSRPILCKDFIVGRYQIAEAREAGADAVLLMATVLDDTELNSLYAYARSLGMDALVEVHDRRELDRVLEGDYRIVGVNSRDLKTLQIDRAHMWELLGRVPGDRVRIAESGVDCHQDVAAVVGLADAVLIGSALMAADSPELAIRELGWRCV